jgi:hypothetical protein
MAGGVGGAPGGAMPVGTVRRDDKRGMKRGRDGVEGVSSRAAVEIEEMLMIWL